jgi:pilus assembly protein CpaC
MIGERGMKVATILMLVFFMFCLGFADPCWASDGAASVNKTPVERLTLSVGESVIIDTRIPVRGVSIAGPDKPDEAIIVDAVVLPPRQVYLSGRNAGVTHVTLLGSANNVIAIYVVEVGPDVTSLKRRLHEVFPNEKGLLVTGTHDGITLSGTVSGTANMAQMVSLAQSYAPLGRDGKRKIMNLLEVAGVQQVMLEVRVSEMSRSLSRRLGINFAFLSASGEQFGLSLLSNLVRLPSQGWPGNPLQVTDNISGILRFLGDGASWTVFIDALKENGLLKVLAEPTLMTLSGKEAKFLAGGEFPIPVPQSGAGFTTITIEYKPYGVALTFLPIVLSNGKISMQVAPEVSELDFSTAISLQGYVIPSISTRRVATTVELADGQSFAIAGLLAEQTREVIRKFPVLGDIPVLGTLFRSSAFQKRDSELIVIVTPRLVKPVDMAKQTIPTDQFVEPDDLEFYLLGALEGRGQPRKSGGSAQSSSQSGGQLEGKFGHITPK